MEPANEMWKLGGRGVSELMRAHEDLILILLALRDPTIALRMPRIPEIITSANNASSLLGTGVVKTPKRGQGEARSRTVVRGAAILLFARQCV